MTILKAGLVLLLFAGLFVDSAPAAPVVDDSLVGVWGARRVFGPEVRGTLEITRSGPNWRARIGPYDLPIDSHGDRLMFELPAAQDGFYGRLRKDGSIRGHWWQPPTVNDGGNFRSPVILHKGSQEFWRGEVTPYQDEWTLYLVVKRRPDGSLGGFIRNPDRNIGLRWDVDRIRREDHRIALLGKPDSLGHANVFGEGTYYADDRRISLYFGSRGGTYDFKRIDDDPTPGFYARGNPTPPFEYRPPVATGDGWRTGGLREVGMVEAPLAELIATISGVPKSREDPDIHALLVARHGKLVFEEYFHGFHRSKPHDTRSASKTLATLLVGAAIESGAKVGTSTRVYDLLYKGKLPPDLDSRKKQMTVEHLLTMSSGFDCYDWAEPYRPGSEETLWESMPDSDFYRYTLQLPMEKAPGEEAMYCSVNANLLGAVVKASTGQAVEEFFQDALAEPLQIQRYYFNPQPTGEPYLGGGARFLPRDFMKFGQVFLDGEWNGKRILGKEFAQRATSSLVTLRDVNIRSSRGTVMQYGYLLWTFEYPYKDRTVKAFMLSGLGGQVVMGIPELDMVIAAFGGNYGDRAGWTMILDYVPKFVLPALQDESL